MTSQKKKVFKLGLLLGIVGCLAGILLIVEGKYFIGIAGTIASTGLALMQYKANR